MTWVQSLASLSGLGIWCCCELWLGHRHGSDPVLLWLWHRLAPADPNRPPVWELPYATCAALKSQKKKKRKRKKVDLKCINTKGCRCNYFYYSNHFSIYTCTKSLHCTPETYTYVCQYLSKGRKENKPYRLFFNCSELLLI